MNEERSIVMDYVDATIPIVKLLTAGFADVPTIRPYTIESEAKLPACVVKPVGRTTFQVLTRSDSDIQALDLCTDIANFLKRNFAYVEDVNIFDVQLQTPIYPSRNEDTDTPEAWCYLTIDYFEN